MIEKLKALLGKYVIEKGLKKAALAAAQGLLAFLAANQISSPGDEVQVAACILGLLELARNFLKVRLKLPYL